MDVKTLRDIYRRGGRFLAIFNADNHPTFFRTRKEYREYIAGFEKSPDHVCFSIRAMIGFTVTL